MRQMEIQVLQDNALVHLCMPRHEMASLSTLLLALTLFLVLNATSGMAQGYSGTAGVSAGFSTNFKTPNPFYPCAALDLDKVANSTELKRIRNATSGMAQGYSGTAGVSAGFSTNFKTPNPFYPCAALDLDKVANSTEPETRTASGAKDWGYDEGMENVLGPSQWKDEYEQCDQNDQGRTNFQAPININTSVYQLVSRPYIHNFNITALNKRYKKAKITNNGLWVTLKSDEMSATTIKISYFSSNYTLEEIHFHWGENDSVGSENTFDGMSYPFVMHFILYQTEMGSFQSAIDDGDGIGVLAVLFKIGPKSNVIPDVLGALGQIREVNKTKTIKQLKKSLKDMLPPGYKKNDYFSFAGSLTYPPCTGGMWYVMKKPLTIASWQVNKFRQLKSKYGGNITHNYRYPTFPLFNRNVFYHTAE